MKEHVILFVCIVGTAFLLFGVCCYKVCRLLHQLIYGHPSMNAEFYGDNAMQNGGIKSSLYENPIDQEMDMNGNMVDPYQMSIVDSWAEQADDNNNTHLNTDNGQIGPRSMSRRTESRMPDRRGTLRSSILSPRAGPAKVVSYKTEKSNFLNPTGAGAKSTIATNQRRDMTSCPLCPPPNSTTSTDVYSVKDSAEKKSFSKNNINKAPPPPKTTTTTTTASDGRNSGEVRRIRLWLPASEPIGRKIYKFQTQEQNRCCPCRPTVGKKEGKRRTLKHCPVVSASSSSNSSTSDVVISIPKSAVRANRSLAKTKRFWLDEAVRLAADVATDAVLQRLVLQGEIVGRRRRLAHRAPDSLEKSTHSKHDRTRSRSTQTPDLQRRSRALQMHFDEESGSSSCSSAGTADSLSSLDRVDCIKENKIKNHKSGRSADDQLWRGRDKYVRVEAASSSALAAKSSAVAEVERDVAVKNFLDSILQCKNNSTATLSRGQRQA